MLNISASKVVLMLVRLLAASIIRPCKLGACMIFRRGLMLSRYTCQSLKIWTGPGCKAARSVFVLCEPKPNRSWSSVSVV